MVGKKLWHGVALAVTGLGSVALQAWVWLEGGASWYHVLPGRVGVMGLMPLLFLGFLALGAAIWSHRRRETRIDPWGDLATEYVEGRIGRDDFLARQLVLKESL
jgi:hypothetical protein